MTAAIQLVVGLGNPGSQYDLTRHNVGFWYVDELARQYNATFSHQAKLHAEVCRIRTADIECWICKPTTYMNESGFAVQAMSNYYKIELANILVAHDELDLDPGTVRLKKGGGHGGHNGLRHIIQQCGGKDFHRLRLGIGHPGHKSKVASYVLQRANSEDETEINIAIKDTLDYSNELLQGQFQKVMNKLHTDKAD